MAHLLISPPLLNSANPWCTTLAQLRSLYRTPHTGAITTRTSLLSSSGFPHDPSVHQFTFFNPSSHSSSAPNTDEPGDSGTKTGSLNTLGYSPLPLSTYLSFVQSLNEEFCASGQETKKPIIVSVTGSAEDIAKCYALICECQVSVKMPLAMELNLSCPNIPGSPPPAYSREELARYLNVLKREKQRWRQERGTGSGDMDREREVKVGIKTPPYTYSEQFEGMIGALLDSAKEDGVCEVDFITAVNTLGSSLLLSPSDAAGGEAVAFQPSLNSAAGTGIGGMAGAPLHPLALGNVYTIVKMLKRHEVLAHVQVIGVGGVADTEGYRRMRDVGASAVGVGTALGRKGVAVFEEIGASSAVEEMLKKAGA
ncbi:Dihydroorotate dehydrogenase A (fumarate) [Curvularia clavata]|uniref:Dihydroorotate dehydrogenase (fumarate) n=1 Tax=Curvularia clavata TaxID=95742 RepID=A0A9Q8Z2B2_CURCL|nr:Dihydroorotate dehydrogenase A (fumarate) [Curvularia clavata]